MEAEAKVLPSKSEKSDAVLDDNVGELVAAVAVSETGGSDIDAADAEIMSDSPPPDSVVEDLNLFDTDFGTAGPTFM